MSEFAAAALREAGIPASAMLCLAYDFAEQAHRGQSRKHTCEPYITHPLAVASVMARHGADEAVLVASLLHDVMEDCGVAEAELASRFGSEVGNMVAALTNCPKSAGNRRERQQIDLVRLELACSSVQTIKLVDSAHNLRSIARYDPAFARVYLPEKVELRQRLVRAEAWAQAELDETIRFARMRQSSAGLRL